MGDIKSPNEVQLPDGPIHHASSDVWVCRVCGYNRNVDRRSSFCVQCGRDFWGNPGTIPDRQELAVRDIETHARSRK